jgi:putative transposase
MTRQTDRTIFDDVVKLVATHGTEAMSAAFATLLEIGMKLEREQVLGAGLYERTEGRRGFANGYKPKTLRTRAGEITVEVPKARGIEFYPSALEKGVRSERALKLALAEMYVQGVSTRRVTEVMQTLCGLDVTSTQVSRAAKELDEELQAWRTRSLGQVPYLILDARYEKVRHGGSVVSCAVLTAIGVLPDGHRSILGTSCSLSEAEVHWRSFLQSLIDRGLHGVRLIVSDDHAGLCAAREARFPGVARWRGPLPPPPPPLPSPPRGARFPGGAWQRCQFHLIRNAFAYVPRASMRADVAAELRTIFNAADREEAERRLRLMVDRHRDAAPALAEWIEDNVAQGLTVFTLPPSHRRKLRTVNSLERLNKEIKRRTRVATLFPNEASLLRLVSAVLSEIDDDWSTGRVYLNVEGC